MIIQISENQRFNKTGYILPRRTATITKSLHASKSGKKKRINFWIYIYIYRNKRARIRKSYKSQLVVLKKGADKTHCFESYPLLAWKLSLSIVGIKDHRLHHNLKKD